ncbi:MAG: hypothetical protein ACQZ2J_05105 [Pseudomonas piscis]|uniref:hypothetical protein n=1 Tax=Pseudomonas piscis TaxID=2614538 RepID=UPI003D278D38
MKMALVGTSAPCIHGFRVDLIKALKDIDPGPVFPYFSKPAISALSPPSTQA